MISLRISLIFLLSLLFISSITAGRDWSKVSDKDLENEINRFEKDDIDNPMELDELGHPKPPSKGKAEMAFVTIRPQYFISKAETESIGATWAKLLVSDHVHVKPYAIEDDKVLFVSDNGFQDMVKIQKLVLEQPECLEFEWNSAKTKPSAKGEAAFQNEMRLRRNEEKMKQDKKKGKGKGNAKGKKDKKPNPIRDL